MMLKFSFLTAIFIIGSVSGGDLSFSDPANVPDGPKWTVGQAQRTEDLDPQPGFEKPPIGFGIVPFYWWLGDPLTKERLTWQLEQMEGMGVSGYQINYAHSDKGGRSYGLTYPSQPDLFSPEWWTLTEWFMKEASKQGAGISLSDYTLGFGQGWIVDEILREHPAMSGKKLELAMKDIPADALVVKEVTGPGGKPQRVAVIIKEVSGSLDPMNPSIGKVYADKFFGAFDKRFPGQAGKGLNFFFSDELSFGLSGNLWTAGFAEEFKKRKGYDIVPELAGLFTDIGPRTPKVRLDYRDVMVSLTEEGFFKPVFDWHQQRGMTLGCDHGGRGRDVLEFGDYFRTQRWNQGPGADQPGLGKDLTKAKVASSIAHLYNRPRVWLEGFYGSSWGTTSAGFVDATLANYAMGFNLLSPHGMYYATHGGWWEWAPPDNTFRMPYWKHMRGFMDCVQRLSFLLSQGDHRCDAAILYPVAPMEAGMGGQEAVKAAFQTGEEIYRKGIDFDYMDFESLDRARIIGKELHVSGEIYRVLVLPGMQAIRHSTLQKALAFKKAGGVVLAVGALPEASDRIGRDDPEVAAMVKELFPEGPTDDVAAKIPSRDYEGPGYIQHRKIGPHDLYVIYNAAKDSECFFRATGKVELWNPWTGTTRALDVTSQNTEGTRLKLPLSEKEIQLIMFSPGKPLIASAAKEIAGTTIALDGAWEFELQPTCDNRFGDFHWPPTNELIGAEARQFEYTEGDPEKGPWQKVTNTFGPQFIQFTGLQADAELPPQGGQRYAFSWRWGIEGDPGHQGYHGLKAEIHDDFLAIGKPVRGPGHRPNVISYETDGACTYFSTTILAPRDMTGYALTGEIKPLSIKLNGEIVTGPEMKLKTGANPLVLCYNKPGRTYFVVSTENTSPKKEILPIVNGKLAFTDSSMAMCWWNNPAILPFDVRAAETRPIGWYRFLSPPGLKTMTLNVHGKVQAWAGGKELNISGNKILVPQPSAESIPVLLKIEQERGYYGGAAFMEPIKLDCGKGQIAAGDWAKIDSLECYSGGVWYRKTVNIPAAKEALLDLGNVAASAEVRINGKPAGIRVAPPWTFDITKLAKPGENRIEVLVYNTMANHYVTIPTNYRGQTTSGLLGPVNIIIWR